MRAADVIGSALFDHGVRHAFGMPGGEVVTLIDGLEAAGIRFCLTRHETQAALMAAGASIVGGAPGVLITTIGPGLANAVNGIADASQEKVPLIVLSGVVDSEVRGRFTHQVIDHKELLAPIVKASFEVEAGSVAATVSHAITMALTPPMGPVHLDISPSVAAAPEPMSFAPRAGREPPPSACAQRVRDVAERLNAAERPIILAGYEAATTGASEALVMLAQKVGAPVITTYKAKGVIPETHALSLGAAGLSPGADTILLDLVKRSDLLLLVGYDPIEMRLPWLDPAPAERIVEIADIPYRHGMHAADLRLIADLPATLDAVGAFVSRKNSAWTNCEVPEARAALERRFVRSGWGPHEIIRVLNDTQSPGDVVTVDSGAHRILLSQMWRAQAPLTLLQSAGFCTMAAALPMAIGAAVTDAHRRVTAVMGDGGLEMGIGELATARDLGVKLTVVVFQDDSLALIALKQRASSLKRCGVSLGPTDFAAVARGFGIRGTSVGNAQDLRSALAAARTGDGVTLIACRFPEEAYDGAL